MSKLRLLMIAPAPAVRRAGGIELDGKFATGMTLQAGLFPGQYDCILRAFDGDIPFQTTPYDPDLHPFGLRVLDADRPLGSEDLKGYDLIMVSADDDRNLDLLPLLRASGARLVATLEYDLDTRLRINALEQAGNLPRRLVRSLKLRLRERKRRALLAAMDGLQANGFPAYSVCRVHDPQTLLFLDNRMSGDIFGTDEEMAARRKRLSEGAPLALTFSGRLEAMKGAQDLVPVARSLAEKSVDFTLDIFGTGSLEPRIRQQITAAGLSDRVTLHAPLPFETGLVPRLRTQADLFLCCHRQSDPSCTYIESMACGLAVVGYDNAMWRGLCEKSGGGWLSPMGDVEALAAKIASLAQDRAALFEACDRARTFAAAHDFENLSRARMAHLAEVGGR